MKALFGFFTACLISSHGQHNCYQLSVLQNIRFQRGLSADILIYW